MDSLSKAELNKIRLERLIKERDTYEVILNQCVEKIKFENRKNNVTKTIFCVPPFLIGYPVFNVHRCVNFIVKKMREKHFKVYIHDRNIIIDWSEDKRDKLQEQIDKEYKEEPVSSLDKSEMELILGFVNEKKL
jgi:hypothetical protein